MLYKDIVDVIGKTNDGRHVRARRTMVYSEVVNDVGLCNMMIELLKDVPQLARVEKIKLISSTPVKEI